MEDWPLWVRVMVRRCESEKQSWVVLSLDQAYEIADLGLLRNEREVTREGFYTAVRPLLWPGLDAVTWVDGPVHPGETMYELRLQPQRDARRYANPRPQPPAPPWHVEEHQLLKIDFYDTPEEEAFYTMTRRPPPGYPGHYWRHSGWTYNRAHSLMEINLSWRSRALERAERREEEAAQRGAWLRRKKREEALLADKRASYERLQAELWAEVMQAYERGLESQRKEQNVERSRGSRAEPHQEGDAATEAV